MTCLLLLTILSARALEVPPGWTPAGPGRALFVPGEPSRGALQEWVVPGGSGAAGELLAALAARGLPATLRGTRGDGTLDLDLGAGSVGAARAAVGPGSATWTVLTATPEALAGLDVPGVLAAAATLPPVRVGGGEALWSADAPPMGPAPASPWGNAWSQPAGTGWGSSPDLVGLWAGRMAPPAGAVDVVLFLDANGRARLERRAAHGTSVQEGSWAVRAGELKVDLLAGDPWTTPYTVGPATLSVVLDRQSVVLVRRR